MLNIPCIMSVPLSILKQVCKSSARTLMMLLNLKITVGMFCAAFPCKMSISAMRKLLINNAEICSTSI